MSPPHFQNYEQFFLSSVHQRDKQQSAGPFIPGVQATDQSEPSRQRRNVSSVHSSTQTVAALTPAKSSSPPFKNSLCCLRGLQIKALERAATSCACAIVGTFALPTQANR